MKISKLLTLQTMRVFGREANVHAVDEKTTHTKELETNEKKKIQKKILQLNGSATFLHILDRIVFLFAEFPPNLTKVLLAFDMYEQSINLEVLIGILVQ